MIAQRLKGAIRRLLHDMGGLDAAAAITGISRSQLSRYQVADSDTFMPVDLVAQLESQEGVSPHVTQTLAALCGAILVPRPRVDADEVWVGRLGELATDAGKLMQGLGTALADGGITAAEINRLGLHDKVSELMTVLAGIGQALVAIETSNVHQLHTKT